MLMTCVRLCLTVKLTPLDLPPRTCMLHPAESCRHLSHVVASCPWIQYRKYFTAIISPSQQPNTIDTSSTKLVHIVQLFGCFTLLALTWFSERVNERTFVAMFQNIWLLPCLLALRFWSGTMKHAWGTFALITTVSPVPINRLQSRDPPPQASPT
jgi:hypothetical protein